MDSIIAETEAAIDRLDKLAEFNKSAVSWKKEFAEADKKEQRRLIGMIIDRVHISRESVDITFKYNLYDMEVIYGGKTIRHGGAPPACPLGSACTDVMTPHGIDNDEGFFFGNPLGAVVVIPTCAIAAFTHSAI